MAVRRKPESNSSKTISAKPKASLAAADDKASSGASRVRKHRQKMKALGLKPVLLWLPDTESPKFKAAVAEAIAAINTSEDEKVILQELEAAFEDVEGLI